jgi:hypothetical protein
VNSDFVLNVSNPGYFVEPQAAEVSHQFNLHNVSDRQASSLATYALLYNLNIIFAYAYPSRSSQVPSSLAWKILNHDSGQHNKFGVYIVKNAVI